ncbi:hypothetical protein AB5J72_50145 [Streptomyces sp. CG1]|uniref:hypothetical protein n=1 Tax=Streptomyces sp. CG1 TaxID=1287523 RepID=UPI0034E262C3
MNWLFTKESYAVAHPLFRERHSPVEVRPGQTPAHSQPLIPYTTTRDTILAALPGRIEFAQRRAAITWFNQSPFHSWKAGFRECAMLARGSEYGMADDDARQRVEAWTTSRDGEFADHAAAGACEGVAFAREAICDVKQFDRLNDPAWLRERFAAAHGDQVVSG